MPLIPNKFQPEYNTQVETATDTTAVSLYVESRNPNKTFELTTPDFKKNSIEDNPEYFSNSSTTNPLMIGLQNMDSMALIISGKSISGIMQFSTTPMKSTVDRMKRADIREATDIVLDNLGMSNPVSNGVKYGLPLATAFKVLSEKIARDVRQGRVVYTNYIERVLQLGRDTMKEWSNNG